MSRTLRFQARAARVLQGFWKIILAKKERERLRQRRLARIRAATFLQACWRRWLAQREVAELRLRFNSARKVQNAWRVVLANRRLEQLREVLRQLTAKAVLIQSHIRVLLAKCHAQRLREALHRLRVEKAIVIQCAFRSHQARKVWRALRAAHLKVQNKAATVVQRHVRGRQGRARAKRYRLMKQMRVRLSLVLCVKMYGTIVTLLQQ